MKKASIKLQLNSSEYKKMRLTSYGMKYLFYVTIFLIGIYLGQYLFKQIVLASSDNNLVEISNVHPFVSDNAQVLSEKNIEEIQMINQELSKTKTKPQLMVITVNQIPVNETIESFTNRIANNIGVGNSQYNNGVVYLLSIKDRKARLEVGYGLKSIIPNSLTNEITDETVKKFYKLNDYSTGIQMVTDRIYHLLSFSSMPENKQLHQIGIFQKIRLFLFDNGLGQWLFIIFFLVFIYYLRKLYKHGKVLTAQLALVDMVNQYLQDINSLGEGNVFTESILSGKRSEKLKIARKQLEENILNSKENLTEIPIPAYYDMNFAFGKVTPEEFINNYVNGWTKLRNSTMYTFYWKTNKLWINSPRIWIGETYWKDAPSSILPSYRINSISENLIPAYKKIYLSPISIALKHPFITFLIIGILVQSNLRQTSLISTSLIFITKIMDFLFKMNFPLVVSSVYFAIIIFFLFDYIQLIGIGVQNRLRLDSLIRSFLKDITQVCTGESNSLKETAKKMDSMQYLDEKKILKKQIQNNIAKVETKNGYPDYYDMKFAYGSVTIADFLANLPSDKHLKNKSMYVNHSNWLSDSSDSSNSSNDTGDFGGGSFGGDGGTSSW